MRYLMIFGKYFLILLYGVLFLGFTYLAYKIFAPPGSPFISAGGEIPWWNPARLALTFIFMAVQLLIAIVRQVIRPMTILLLLQIMLSLFFLFMMVISFGSVSLEEIFGFLHVFSAVVFIVLNIFRLRQDIKSSWASVA